MIRPVKPPPRRPGRPRSESARRRILEVAARLMEAGGPGAVTMEAVAAGAGVGKPTLYRSWPNREALAMAALMATSAPSTKVRETASALDDWRRQLRKVAEVFASPRGRNTAQMTASADADSELAKAFRTQVMLASREQGRALLARAVSGGEVRRDVNIDIALDMIYGPLFYRLLVGHAPLDARFVEALVDEALAGLRRRRGASAAASGRGGD